MDQDYPGVDKVNYIPTERGAEDAMRRFLERTREERGGVAER
jgi:hypothetical protein